MNVFGERRYCIHKTHRDATKEEYRTEKSLQTKKYEKIKIPVEWLEFKIEKITQKEKQKDN